MRSVDRDCCWQAERCDAVDGRSGTISSNLPPEHTFYTTTDLALTYIHSLPPPKDYVLGSMDPAGPLQKTRKLIVEQGAWFNNGFATTPICCPSRAEITTGR